MPPGPRAAQPTKKVFDPFNSSSTGHQRADNRLAGSTSWRDSRTRKLREQCTSGGGGGKRVKDSVGAGSEGFGIDGRKENGGWVKGASGLRESGQRSISEGFGQGIAKPGLREDEDSSEKVWRDVSPSELLDPLTSPIEWDKYEEPKQVGSHDSEMGHVNEDFPASFVQATSPSSKPRAPQIFANLTIHINGSTHPYISDHKIKHLLATHGARISITPGRRSVTHVILGRSNTGSKSGGAGGGLAGGKLQKEIVRGKGMGKVKFVSAEWVVESVKAGKRLSEGRFEGVGVKPAGVGGLEKMFARAAEKGK